MAKASTKSKKEVKKKKQSTTVVHFADYINSYDVAEILLKKIEATCMSSKEMAHIVAEGGFDIEGLAAFLDRVIDPDAINEFMNNEFGQGLLVGLYIAQVEQTPESDEDEQEG